MQKPYIVLTFDDGYLNHYQIARSLNRQGINATFFIITHLKSYGGKTLLAKKPELIREISEMDHEIGSHSCTHPNLVDLTLSNIEKELKASKELLEGIINKKVQGFAYPYGAYDKRVLDTVKLYYDYARSMGKANRWNVCLNPYKVGSMGVRHLLKLPFKLHSNDLRLVILAFHHEPLSYILTLACTLKKVKNFRIATLADALKELGLIH